MLLNSNRCDFSPFAAKIPFKMYMAAVMTYMNIQSLGVKGFHKKTAKSAGKMWQKTSFLLTGRQQKQPPMQSHLWKPLTTQQRRLPPCKGK